MNSDESQAPSSADKSPSNNQDPETREWLEYFGWQAPVTILLATMVINSLIQFVFLVQQGHQLGQNKTQMDQMLPRAEYIKEKLDGLARDIVDLGRTDPGARQIQDEFHIQLSGNNPDQSSPPVSSASAFTPALAPAPAAAPAPSSSAQAMPSSK